MFEPSIQPDSAHERTCGACGERKPVEEFYKDGTNNDGSTRYRRDCKECYRQSRLLSRQAKRVPAPKRRPAAKRRKK